MKTYKISRISSTATRLDTHPEYTTMKFINREENQIYNSTVYTTGVLGFTSQTQLISIKDI